MASLISSSKRFPLAASKLAMVAATAFILGGCDEQRSTGAGSYRAYQPIPAEALVLMKEKGTDSHQPILIRAFKKEAELEIWKMRPDGEYVHFKTYPMCRWSGQLGPKRREGDRQVPEGFYTITQSQLNPNSAYYLSINVGYPNAYDKANGFTGSLIMVHGDCSSAGCFSMTDEQIAEIYAIAREAFGGGQRAIQMQSLPFRMSPENLAKHRFDPNIRFWKQLKEGVDQFEVSKRETKVAVCNQRYVFGATPIDPNARLEPAAQCPPLADDPELKSAVAAKQQHDDTRVAELVSKGTKAVKVVYADGGSNPAFAETVSVMSRPDAVAEGPKEIAINEKGQPIPALKPTAKKPSGAPASTAIAAAKPPATAPAGKTTLAKSQTDAAPAAFAAPTQTAAAPKPDSPFYKRWLGMGKSETPVVETSQAPADAPAPAVSPAPQPPRKGG